MKKTLVFSAMLSVCLCLAGNNVMAQAAGKKVSGPYTIRNSAGFESPKGHDVQDPFVYPDGVLQINNEWLESFNFQWFSPDLKLVKENTVETEHKFSKTTRFTGFLHLKSKLYVTGREVFKDIEAEGVTVCEISPKELNLKGDAKNLFKSSGKVRMENVIYGPTMGFMMGTVSPYSIFKSDDETKFMCTYALAVREKNDKLNKDIIGIMVYDENLTKLWGDEYEMPYTEAKMDNLGYTLTNDGKVCLLAKVYEGESKKDGAKDKTKPNYHFEVLVYQKDVKQPKRIEIRLDNFFNKEAYIYENNGSIVVAGFYGHKPGAGVDGAYTVTLDVEKATISKVNGGYYELPTEFLKSFMSERAKKKAEEKMEENDDYDLELNNLDIRAIYSTPDGSTKIVSEIYYIVAHRNSNGATSYTYHYHDAVILNIKGGKLEWVKKIPKITMNGSGGRGLSVNSLVVGDNLHVFWKDKPENSKRAESEKPVKFGGTNGMLRGCVISPKGDMKFVDIVDVGPYDMHFDIKSFIEGPNHNLLSTERRKGGNMIFSIDVKP